MAQRHAQERDDAAAGAEEFLQNGVSEENEEHEAEANGNALGQNNATLPPQPPRRNAMRVESASMQN